MYTASARIPFVPTRRRRRGRNNGGYTLIEAAAATIIIGVGFTAMLNLLASGTVANKEGAELTTALNLANNIHERAVRIGYDDLFDLEGTYSPAIDSRGSAVAQISGWSQVVDVCYVDENRLTLPVPDTQYEPTARVTVVVMRNNKSVYRTSWIASAPN